MNHFPPFALQSLESRTLMSAVPHSSLHEGHEHPITNPTMVADLAKFKDDIAKFTSDQQSSKAMLEADMAALKAACDTLKADVAPVLLQRKADEQSWTAKLVADQAAIDAAGPDADVAGLQAALKADQATWHTVRESTGHQLYVLYLQDQPAVTAAQQKLKPDQEQSRHTIHDDAVQLHSDWLQCQADQKAMQHGKAKHKHA